MKKRIMVLLLLLFFIFGYLNIVRAEYMVDSQMKIATLDTKIDPMDYQPGQVDSNDEFDTIIGIVLGGIRDVGIIVSVVALMIIGLKTMIGSVEEKSEYKKSLITYIIGITIFAACSTLPDIIYKIFHI